jgi:hypothetical protein
MSRTTIYTLYVILHLLIVAAVVWCVFQRWPVRQYLLPAIVLFFLGGVWLIVMTLRSTKTG